MNGRSASTALGLGATRTEGLAATRCLSSGSTAKGEYCVALVTTSASATSSKATSITYSHRPTTHNFKQQRHATQVCKHIVATIALMGDGPFTDDQATRVPSPTPAMEAEAASRRERWPYA